MRLSLFATVTLAVPPLVIVAGLPVIVSASQLYPVGAVGLPVSVTAQLDPDGIPVIVTKPDVG